MSELEYRLFRRNRWRLAADVKWTEGGWRYRFVRRIRAEDREANRP
jgi:hypothetical protein